MKRNLPLLLVLVAACADPAPPNESLPPDTVATLAEPPAWRAVTVDSLGVSFEMPPDWQLVSGTLPSGEVALSLTPDAEGSAPWDIHAPPAVTHVTLYPQGAATELPFGDTLELLGQAPVPFVLDPVESIHYVLADSSTWAYYLRPAAPPATWNEYGFVFAQVAARGVAIRCIGQDNATEKELAACDPLAGDHVRRFGRTNPATQQTVERVLASLQLVAPLP